MSFNELSDNLMLSLPIPMGDKNWNILELWQAGSILFHSFGFGRSRLASVWAETIELQGYPTLPNTLTNAHLLFLHAFADTFSLKTCFTEQFLMCPCLDQNVSMLELGRSWSCHSDERGRVRGTRLVSQFIAGMQRGPHGRIWWSKPKKPKKRKKRRKMKRTSSTRTRPARSQCVPSSAYRKNFQKFCGMVQDSARI